MNARNYRRRNRKAAVFPALREERCGGAVIAHRRDLLTRLDLVFIDTTSLSFESACGQTLGQHGYTDRICGRSFLLCSLMATDGPCARSVPGEAT